ncbi:MAG: hypothetical protein AMS25_05315 [Gemmatimonas sp. SM23_52]|nr:MAG: hypothetical protein AMS25_05315 [Gemmatimonas sp. SM23_52]
MESPLVGVLAGRDPQDSLEAALQMVRARVHVSGKLSQCGFGFRVLVDVTADATHALKLGVSCVGQVGAAAATAAPIIHALLLGGPGSSKMSSLLAR